MGTLKAISRCVGNWNNSPSTQLQVIWIHACADVVVFFSTRLLSPCASPAASPAEVGGSCCNPGAPPQSLLHRHAGSLRQRYGGTSCCPQAQDARASPPIMNCVTHWIYLVCLTSACKSVRACVCLCVDRTRCRPARSAAGSLQTSVPQTPSPGQELQHQEQVRPASRFTAVCVSVCACVTVGACECATSARLCSLSPAPSPPPSVCWQQEVTSHSLLSLFPSTGFWTRSCRSWLRSYKRRSV